MAVDVVKHGFPSAAVPGGSGLTATASTLAILMTASAVILDGIDNQMLGLAAPTLIREWGISRQVLGNVFALGFLGMALGTLTSGWLGDRFGRKIALVLGVVVFGLATCATGMASSVHEVAALRFLAGVGLGGVPGTAAALISEFASARYRSVAVTAGIICVSLGGVVGSIAAAFILPHLGWRYLFYIGGGFTLVSALALAVFLPESPIFSRQGMALRDGPVPAGREGPTRETVATAELFRAPLRWDTILVSCALMSGMFMVYLMFNWAPTLLVSMGFSSEDSSWGATAFNSGGALGAVLAALVMTRIGSRRTLGPLAVVGSLVCLALALFPAGTLPGRAPILLGIFVLGLSACAVQSAVFALAAQIFPAALRARGLGIMGAGGRVGAIGSALAGGTLIAGGSPWFFGCLAALMIANAACLILVSRQIPASVRAS